VFSSSQLEMMMRTTADAGRARHNRRTATILTLCLGFVLAWGFIGYRTSSHLGFMALSDRVGNELDLLAAAIDDSVTRLAPIPSTLELDRDIGRLLRAPEDAIPADLQGTVNRFLEQLNARIDALATFVVSTRGRVIASSDWIYSDNLLGTDISRRPIFQAAVTGTPYRQFAIDPARDEAGYFFAHPIRDEANGWNVIGVAVLKVGLAGLERQWLSKDVAALIVDNNGVVVLSSIPEWKYTTLKPLEGEMLEDVATVQFNRRAIDGFPLKVDLGTAGSGVELSVDAGESFGGGLIRGGGDYLVLSRPLLGSAWRLLTFTNLAPVRAQAATHALLAMAGAGLVLMAALVVVQRRRIVRQKLQAKALLERANAQLEHKVARRTQALTETNLRLQKEVVEREHAEATLRAAQDELVQAAKLAVLGQLATGITHELNQPLGAIRTLAGNALEFLRRGKSESTEKNLTIITRLADQMGAIITPLKTFARKSPAVPVRVDLGRAVGNALFLLEQKLQHSAVSVQNDCSPGRSFALCDQNRLEQVLVNLIGNAADAMRDQPRRSLSIAAAPDGDGAVLLTVADTGPGLPDEIRERLFEPFFTTKPAGEGLGLGLAISRDIVRDFGGDLEAGNTPEGGARFRLRLPAVRETVTP
jgi:two-component system C4-dicarboxylate transport sensor histidine kinase DctB